MGEGAGAAGWGEWVVRMDELHSHFYTSSPKAHPKEII